MRWSCPAWCLGAALVIFAPVGLRVLSWSEDQVSEVAGADVRAGATLFSHEWQPNDPLCRGGDGLGPVYNATSCAACHRQGGLGGGGGLEHNVTTFVVVPNDPDGERREGVIHAHASTAPFQETLALLSPELPALAQPSLEQLRDRNQMNGKVTIRVDAAGLRSLKKQLDGDQMNPRDGRRDKQVEPLNLPPHIRLAQRNTPALFGAGLIDALPDRVILANMRKQRLRHGLAPGDTDRWPVGRVGRLANGRIGKFGWKAQAANLAEFVQAACANELGLSNPGHAQARSLARPDYQAVGLDLTQKQCDQLTAFIATLPRPAHRLPANPTQRAHAERGQALFHRVGCAGCHTPDLGSVAGLYSDLLLHRMGQDLQAGGSSYGGELPPPESSPSEGPLPEEWRTPPLWGVADSAPYLHDGRAASLEEAIRMHGGQGARAAERFRRLSSPQQAQVIAFLKTLRAPTARSR